MDRPPVISRSLQRLSSHSTEMEQSFQLVFIICLVTLFPESQGQRGECCAVKVVNNSADISLDGTYTLTAHSNTKREDICIDGCVYQRDGLEYCFISKPVAESADVVCDNQSDSFSASGSSKVPGARSSGSTVSTGSMKSNKATGATETGAPGSSRSNRPPRSTASAVHSTTRSLGNLFDIVNAAMEAKDTALAAITAADEAIHTANEAREKVSSFDFKTLTATKPLGYQASSIVSAYPLPATCDAVSMLLDDIVDILIDNPAAVTPLMAALGSISLRLDVPCTSEAVASLYNKGNEVISTADDAIAVQTNLKTQAIEEYKEANDVIISLNEPIGFQTVAAGTPSPIAVATMFVEREATRSTFERSTGGFLPNGPTLTHGTGATEPIVSGAFGEVESSVPRASSVPRSAIGSGGDSIVFGGISVITITTDTLPIPTSDNQGTSDVWTRAFEPMKPTTGR